jgi:hypothetical protein
MAGVVTVTGRTPVLVIVSAPGAVTVTVVDPLLNGSNANP